MISFSRRKLSCEWRNTETGDSRLCQQSRRMNRAQMYSEQHIGTSPQVFGDWTGDRNPVFAKNRVSIPRGNFCAGTYRHLTPDTKPYRPKNVPPVIRATLRRKVDNSSSK